MVENKENLKVVKLSGHCEIKYDWRHNKHGIAEFIVCPIFKYGKLKKILIYPQQQETDVDYYEIECHGQRDFRLISWTHKGVKDPMAWLYFWCKEHKCLEMRVYVPPHTDTLSINQLSSANLIFKKGDEDGKY